MPDRSKVKWSELKVGIVGLASLIILAALIARAKGWRPAGPFTLAGWGWTSLPFLPLLRQPTLVLTGDDDPIIPAVNGRILAGLIRHAELRTYPGGHIDLVANPGLLGPLIDRFLASERATSDPAIHAEVDP